MYQIIFKRLFDITVSLSLISLLLPIWIPLCIVLLVTGEHRVFFVQKRVGLNSKTFNIWKHATMIRNSEKMKGGLYTTKNDPRILPTGQFLRKTKLDEIPQLFHILTGKMSFVGPRPLVINNPYPKEIQDAVYRVKPGVTGIGSIIFRNEEKLLTEAPTSPEDFYANFILPYKADLELWYQDHVSFLTHMKLMFCTTFALVFPETNLPFIIFPSLPPVPSELNLRVA